MSYYAASFRIWVRLGGNLAPFRPEGRQGRLDLREGEAWSGWLEAGELSHALKATIRNKGKPLRNFKPGYVVGSEQRKRLIGSNMNCVCEQFRGRSE